MFQFYIPWKQKKIKGFLMFSGGIKWENQFISEFHSEAFTGGVL